MLGLGLANPNPDPDPNPDPNSNPNPNPSPSPNLFSTSFSPGAGVPGLKALRYLFARFYLSCRVPGQMEGCPDDYLLVGCTIASGCLGTVPLLVSIPSPGPDRTLTQGLTLTPTSTSRLTLTLILTLTLTLTL